MGIVYVSIAVLAITAFAFVAKLSARRGVPSLDLTFVLFLAASVLGFFWARAHHVGSGAYPAKLLLLAAMAGGGGAVAAFSFNYAVRIGHFGFSHAVYRSSFLIPVLFSVLVFNAGLDRTAATGILLIVISLFLISWSNDSFRKGKKEALRWFAVIMLSFFSGGLPRIAQLLVSENRLNPAAYLFASYTAGFIVLLAYYPARRKIRLSGAALLFGALAAFTSYVGVYFTIKALGAAPASVVFPITLSAPILLGMLISFILKEKITVRGWAGVLSGVTGILILAFLTYQ